MNKAHASLICATTLLLAQCAAPRQAPDARGVAFPQQESSYLKEGSLVAPETVQRIQPGTTRDQVRQQLGNPHFTEGLFTADDWNYILTLPAMAGGAALTCQFQVQFEKRIVKATYWQTETCAQAAAPAASTAAAPVVADAAVETHRENDLRFAFGRSGLADLDAPARARLEALAEQAGTRAASIQKVAVYGYADRIGSPDSTYGLSLARARTVADLFVAKGIDPARIEVVGKGRFESAADCRPGRGGEQLIACLAPDRRVSVTVWTAAN